MNDVLADYAAAATPELIAGYDTLPPEQIYAAVRDFLPRAPSRIADIGAGTGRDAAWLAEQGHRVLAVEPVRAFREAGVALHGGQVEWLDEEHILYKHGPSVYELPADGRGTARVRVERASSPAVVRPVRVEGG